MSSLPPPSPSPPPPPPAPPKRRPVALIVAGVAVVVAAAVIGGLLLLRGGNDDEATTTTTTVSTTTTAEVTTTVAETLVITVPETAETLAPVPGPVPGPGEVVVTDDTGLFQVLAPDTFEVNTAPLDIDGVSVASVTSAGNLGDFDAGYDETGYAVMALPPEVAPDSSAAITILTDQLTGDCQFPQEMPDLDTAIGPARHLIAQGCGPNNATAVVLAIDETNSGFVFVVVAQGPAGADEVTVLAQSVLESIYIN